MLSDRQMRFVQEYCKDFVATKAYMRAGYSEDGAASGASRLLSNVNIQIAIEDEKRANLALVGVTRGYLMKNLKDVVDAYRPRACRYCYGIEHEYQWTQREYERELSSALSAGTAVPDLKGGFGYTRRREPNEDCPRCFGEGEPRLDLDQPKLADKIKAVDSLSKLGGFVVERKEISGPGGQPIQTANAQIDFNALSDDELLAFCQPKGTIEGTLEDSERNHQTPKQLEPASSP